MKSNQRHQLRAAPIRLLALACALCATAVRADELATSVYVRSDSDDTLVVAPRLHALLAIEETTNLNVTYAVDVWTSASIDIMTSASKVPVTEQRDELNFALDHGFDDLTLSGAYRYSTEPDYVSHGGSLGLSYELAGSNATFAAGLSGSSDSVGKAGDPGFDEAVGTLGGRLSFSQVLGKETVAQLIYEIGRARGYLASPYRYVAIGGDGRCTAPAGEQGLLGPLCVPEASPGTRVRHAFALELRHALGAAWSIGGGYRFYLDDWKLQSHTLKAEVSWLAAADTLFAARYRFYTQGAAAHYQAHYLVAQPYVTTDKELSPLTSHRMGVELDQRWILREERSLRAILSFAPLFYSYSDFPALESITAFEVNATLVFVP
jgi:hypothetical protein